MIYTTFARQNKLLKNDVFIRKIEPATVNRGLDFAKQVKQ